MVVIKKNNQPKQTKQTSPYAKYYGGNSYSTEYDETDDELSLDGNDTKSAYSAYTGGVDYSKAAVYSNETSSNDANKNKAAQALVDLKKQSEKKDEGWTPGKNIGDFLGDAAKNTVGMAVDTVSNFGNVIQGYASASTQDRLITMKNEGDKNISEQVTSGKMSKQDGIKASNELQRIYSENSNRILSDIDKGDKALRTITTLPRAAASSVIKFGLGVPGSLVEIAGNVGKVLTPDDSSLDKTFEDWSKYGQSVNRDVTKSVDDLFQMTEKDPQLLTDVGGTIGNVVAQGATGMWLKSLLIPVTKYTVETFNETFNSAKEAGKDDWEAAAISSTNAGAQALVERWGLNKFLNPTQSNIIVKTLSRMATENVEEVLQLLTDNTAKLTYNPEQDLLEGLGYTILLTSLTTGAIGSVNTNQVVDETNKALEQAGSQERVTKEDAKKILKKKDKLDKTNNKIQDWRKDEGIDVKEGDVISQEINQPPVEQPTQIPVTEELPPEAGDDIVKQLEEPITAPSDLLVSHEGAPDTVKVSEYISKIQAGETIEPIKVIREGDKYGIEDGKHRFEAYKQLGIKDISIEIVEPKLPTAPKTKAEVPVYVKPVRTGGAGIPGKPKVTYNTGDANLDGIVNDSIISYKGTAGTAELRAEALDAIGITKSQRAEIRNIAVRNVDKNNGRISNQGIQQINEVLSGVKTKTVAPPKTKAEVPTIVKAVKPKGAVKKLVKVKQPVRTKEVRTAVDNIINETNPELFNNFETGRVLSEGGMSSIPRIHVDDLKHYLGKLSENIPTKYKRNSGDRDIYLLAQNAGFDDVDNFIEAIQSELSVRSISRESKLKLAEMRKDPELIAKAEKAIAKEKSDYAPPEKPYEPTAKEEARRLKNIVDDTFASRVYRRLQAENPELKGEAVAERMQLKADATKAVKLIEEDKQQAFRIAMGVETSSNVTSTATNIAMAEKALAEGNNTLYARLVKNRSLAQTRRGQELVAEKGSVTDNSASRYTKELIKIRLEKLGNKYLSGISLKKNQMTKTQKATKILDKEVDKAMKKLDNKKFDMKKAQELIDSLRCK